MNIDTLLNLIRTLCMYIYFKILYHPLKATKTKIRLCIDIVLSVKLLLTVWKV